MNIWRNTLVQSVGLLAGMPLAAMAREPTDRPNIVILYADDSGYGDYQYNGNPLIETPNLTRLANQGANFTQFYVATAACSASRYALLTGRYPGRSGLGRWVIGPGTKRYLHPKEITLADALRARGYATAMFGKWHLGTPNKSNNFATNALPVAHGFDKWIGTNVSHDYHDAMLMEYDPAATNGPIKGYKIIKKGLPVDDPVTKNMTERYTDAAVKFIRDNQERPFLLYMAYNQPHLGLFVSDKFKGKSRRGMLGDVLAEIDNSVGRINQALADAGISRNTLIIYSSDNGPWVVFRNRAKSKYGDSRLKVGYAWPFRDGKGSTWEGGHRVPGIFYWPGMIKPHYDRHPVSTLDIFPTVMKITGGKIPTDRSMDGRDITPYLSQSNAAVPEFDFLYSYYDNQPSAIRVGPWKLHIRIGSQTGNNYGFKASVQKPLLFQVEHDLGERIDVAAKYPQRVDAMRKRLLEERAQIRQEGSFWDKQPAKVE